MRRLKAAATNGGRRNGDGKQRGRRGTEKPHVSPTECVGRDVSYTTRIIGLEEIGPYG